MISKEAAPFFFALYLAFVAIPWGVATGVLVGLALTRRQVSNRWPLIPYSVIGPIGFILGELAVAFGPRTVRIHHLPGGTTLTNYNEPFFQPVRYGIAVLGATLLVALFHAAHARWRWRPHFQDQPGVAL